MTRAQLDLRLFGPVAAFADGQSVTLPRSRKVRALLALVAASPTGVARSRLADLLFADNKDPQRACGGA